MNGRLNRPGRSGVDDTEHRTAAAEAEAGTETETANEETVQDDGPLETELTPEEAFSRFLELRFARIVAAVKVIVRDHSVAEDLAQEAFARAYINWNKLWPEGNPGGWVHRVAVNLAISWHRRAGRELRAIARLGRRTPMEVAPPEAHPELHAAVRRLPARQRTAVALYYVLGLPVEETAKVMGCKEGTVKSLLFKARERLRGELGEAG